MDPISSKTALAAAGAGGEALYVDDVFSTFLYDGNKDEFTSTPPATQNIVNNIDNVENKGLVWQKARSYSGSQGFSWSNYLTDTERGATKVLRSDTTNGETTENAVTSFNTNGFTAGSFNLTNNDKAKNVAWNFRAAPGFFDVVTYTGNGTSGREIPHSLGSKPGFFVIKSTSNANDWLCYHRGLGYANVVRLNLSQAKSTQANFLTKEPTADYFAVGGQGYNVNQTGETYVCYLFAHNDQQFGTDGDEAIVHCGTFNGGGVLNSNTIEVNTGFEPQFVLIKRSNSTSDWYLLDVMRGMDNDGNNERVLFPNTTDDEGTPFRLWAYQNGFAFDEDLGGSSAEWIYMAIRRPHKPPEAGTDVFATAFRDASEPGFNSGFPVDFAFEHYTTGGNSNYPGFGTRLTGRKKLKTSATASEVNNTTYDWDYQDGWNNVESTSSTIFSHMFKRAPRFMDVVGYTGNLSTNNVTHNLESVPELIIVKRRDTADEWPVYSSLTGNTKHLRLNTNSGSSTNASYWNSTTPTSTQFTLGARQETNANGDRFIAVLFATLPGISKVGSYTGTGSAINVDCGFTAGARFVLIKRTDSTGDWYVWDSTRGIVSGNDPYLLLNSFAAQVTNTDYIDPLNAGFTVTSSAPAALNASGGTYLFLAIA